jgi:maltose/moltooligosaccharide transporter
MPLCCEGLRLREATRGSTRPHAEGPWRRVKDIASAVRTMPVAMHKIGLAFFFQWYAMFIYWQFVVVSIGETAFNSDPETGGPAWDRTRKSRPSASA